MINKFIFFFKNLVQNFEYKYAFFSGILLVLCLPPFNFWLLLFPSLIFLFLGSYNAKSNKNAFLIGWFFGLSFFLFGLYWIFNSFLIRSGIFIYFLPICLLILSIFLSIFIGLVTLFNYKFKTNLITNIFLFSIFWTFSEILRGYLFTGFPWNLLAHSISNFNSLLQICSIFGVYGLSFFTIYFILSIGIFILFFNKKKRYFLFITSLSLLISVFFYGELRLKNLNLEEFDSSVFRIVQPNISQKDKLKSSKIENNYKKLVDLSFQNKMGSLNKSENLIIIWPETSILNTDHLNFYSTFNKLKNNLKKNEFIISGAFRNEKKNNFYYNSILVIDKNLSFNFLYDKIHLVPFGEYIPFGNFFNQIGFNFSSLEKGKKNQKIINYKNIPVFNPLICYEVIFPGKFIKDENKSIFSINFTNDAWFGNSIGPYQHFNHSIFRAIEEGKHLIRVANTGISGSIDPYGRVKNELQLNSLGYFDTKIFVLKKNNKIIKTVYSKYQNNLIIILLIILLFLVYFLKIKNFKKIRKF